MSSRLSRTDLQGRLQERSLIRQLPTINTKVFHGPWHGLAPDAEQAALDFSYFRDSQGLVARSAPGLNLGEVLTHDDGYSRISLSPDNDYANLGTDAAGADPGTANTVVVRLTQIARTDASGAVTGEFDITPIAGVAGDGSTDDTHSLWRISPGTGEWVRIDASATAIANSHELEADRDGFDSFQSMPDSCVFASGAPARTAYSGDIDEPCLIYTTNHDRVMVFPSESGVHTYEPLTDQFNSNFHCVSVESFGNRVYFLNTFEDTIRYRRRLRRSARGTADPLTSATGAGFIDFDEFEGNGVRCETIGDVLAVYFEDGTAFVRETGVATAPNAVEILQDRRGLLGTHAVVSLGDQRHFGIFTDGWWFLNSAGQWQEAGTATINNIEIELWKKTFYERLDIDNRHRIQLYYDQPKNWVYISFPTAGEAEMSEVWIYDVNGNRVWRERYEVTCWGEYARQITSSLLWSETTDLWSTIVGTWASLDAQFSLNSLAHGDTHGLVFGHDPDLITRDGITPSYSLTTVRSPLDRADTLKMADLVLCEYANVGNLNSHTLGFVNNDDMTVGGTVLFNGGSAGNIRPARRHARLSGEQLGITISGQGPVIIHSIGLDWYESSVRRRF